MILINFVVFHVLLLLLSVLSKVYRKILVLFRLVQNFKILDLAIVKVEKSISQLPTCQGTHFLLFPTSKVPKKKVYSI